MRALLLAAALLLALPGCFTTWATLRVAGYPGAVDEDVREERVPLPGISETLVVSLPMENVSSTDVRFRCAVDQHGRDAVYRAAYRYGRGWKKATAIMFVAEAALGSVLLLTTPRDHESYAAYMLGGGLLAVDALGTGALFFAPRKEIYARTEVPVTTHVRDACPDGVVVEIGGESLPINAAGRLGDAATTAFDQWMQSPTGSLVVSYSGRSALVNVTDAMRCEWRRQRSQNPAVEPPCVGYPSVLAARIDVPAGTLSTVAAVP